MKAFLLSLSVSCLCLDCDLLKTKTVPVKLPWIKMQKSIGEYRRHYINKPVLVLFSATWDATGIIPKMSLEQRQNAKVLKKHQVILIHADLTQKDVLLWNELKKYSKIPSPPLMFIFPANSYTKHPIPCWGLETISDQQPYFDYRTILNKELSSQ